MAIITAVGMNRSITEAESYALSGALDKDVAAGATDDLHMGVNEGLDTPVVKFWTDEAAANAFVEFVKAFSPAPVYAHVITIGPGA
jgi:hypothetical protein